MSVAFRRDSDEEHLEPRFERPLPPGPNLVTPRGRRLIEERVAGLEAELRAGSPDEAVARDLRYWRARAATASCPAARGGAAVAFGARVTFRLDGRERQLRLVGHDEADGADALLAFSAPLARALLGAEPGDHADFAGRTDAIEVLAVDWPADD